MQCIFTDGNGKISWHWIESECNLHSTAQLHLNEEIAAKRKKEGKRLPRCKTNIRLHLVRRQNTWPAMPQKASVRLHMPLLASQMSLRRESWTCSPNPASQNVLPHSWPSKRQDGIRQYDKEKLLLQIRWHPSGLEKAPALLSDVIHAYSKSEASLVEQDFEILCFDSWFNGTTEWSHLHLGSKTENLYPQSAKHWADSSFLFQLWDWSQIANVSNLSINQSSDFLKIENDSSPK